MNICIYYIILTESVLNSLNANKHIHTQAPCHSQIRPVFYECSVYSLCSPGSSVPPGPVHSWSSGREHNKMNNFMARTRERTTFLLEHERTALLLEHVRTALLLEHVR